MFSRDKPAQTITLRSQIIHYLAPQVDTLIDSGEGEGIEKGVYKQGINNQLVI